MKSMMRKTTLREIKQTFGRFFAIFAIIALGVGFFSGVRITTPAMVHTVDMFLQENQFYDYRLISTLGWEEEDVEAFRGREDVRYAEGAYTVDVLYTNEAGEELVLKTHSMPDEINGIELVDGRLPENDRECVVDAVMHGIPRLGEHLYVADTNEEDTRKLLAYRELTVVGFVDSSYYVNFERGTTSIGTGTVDGFMYVPKSSFDSDIYTELFVKFDEDYEIYSKAYKNYMEGKKDKWETYVELQADARYDRLIAEANEEIADGEAELADKRKEGEEELADAKAELDDARVELNDAKEELDDAKGELADAKKTIDDNKSKLADAKEELDDAKTELNGAKKKLKSAKTELTDAKKEIDKGEAELAGAKAEIDRGEEELAGAKAELDKGEAELADAKREIDKGEAELAAAKAGLDEAKTQLAQSKAQLDETWRQLEAGEASVAQGQAQIDEARAALEVNDSALVEQEKTFAVKEAEYNAKMEQVAGMLELLPAEQQEALAVAKAELDAGRAALKEGRAQLEAAREEIEKNQAALNVEKKKLAEGKEAYQKGLVQYEDGMRVYEKGLFEYEAGKEKLAAGAAEYEAGAKKLAEGAAEYEAGKEKLAEGAAEYEAGRKELDTGKKEYEKGKKEYAKGEKEYEKGKKEYEKGLEQYEDGRSKLADGEREYYDGLVKYQDGVKEYEDGLSEYEDGLAEYEDGVREFDEKIADAEGEIADAKKELADIEEPDTYLLERNTNIGYACFENDSEIVAQVAKVFPIFFVLVAALVCITTMGRMVEEQRTQIGTFKALGYSEGAIMGKFMFYSGSAAVLGCILGYSGGIILFPKVIWTTYKLMYHALPIRYIFDWKLAVLSILAALFCSIGTTWLTCRYELSETAASLMRPKAPKAGKRVFLEYLPAVWNHLKFLYKVSIRNIFRYKGRFFMMIVGIGGCTALLLTGFGIKDSIADFASMQYDEILTADASMTYKNGKKDASAQIVSDGDSENTDTGEVIGEAYTGGSEDGKEILPESLAEQVEAVSEEYVLLHEASWDLLAGDYVKEISLVVPENLEEIDHYVHFHTTEGEPLAFPKAGEALVCESLAKRYEITVGDEVILRDADMRQMHVKVTGIFENHVYNYVFLAPETMESQLSEPLEYNSAYINFPEGTDIYKQSAEIAKDSHVTSVTLFADVKERMAKMMSSLNYIVLLVIASAAGLAFIVLYNLTNINITERLREIATIKVLGFFKRETSSYVFRENIALTLFGIIFGLFLGVLLHRYVMAQIVVDMVCFRVQILPISFLYSVVLTFIFTFLVNAVMEVKLDRINMAESLKSVE